MKKSAKSFIVKPETTYWACRACWPAILELGFIRDVGSICYLKDIIPAENDDRFLEGSYVLILLGGQGHRGDEIVIDEKPVKIFEEVSKWNNYKPETIILSLEQSVNLYNAFLKHASKLELERPLGWMVERWLSSRMANVVERWEKKFGIKVEDYYRDFYAKKVVEYHKKQEEAKNVVSNNQ